MSGVDCTSDEFDEMLHSRPWFVYQQRLTAMLDEKRNDLVKDQGHNETLVCRGWCQALRRVVESVPGSIVSELEADD